MIYEQIMELPLDTANLSKLHAFLLPPPQNIPKHALLPRTLDQLSNGICNVTSTCLAFAALKEDASVVTWGHRNRGGDSTEVTRSNGGGGGGWWPHVMLIILEFLSNAATKRLDI